MQKTSSILDKEIICIRGAGDLATGVIQKFVRAGYRIYALETMQPTTIRRQVALSTAISKGTSKVEDITARHVECSFNNLEKCWEEGIVPIIVDPSASSIKVIKPAAVIDAIIAKRNIGTNRNMAPITIGMGPGFSAGKDVDVVIETMRGHSLGQIIFEGEALPNTGTPGNIGGQSSLRVMHAPNDGTVKHMVKIGDWVCEGQPVFTVSDIVVVAPFDGLIRGLIEEGTTVKKGLKSADIDPRRLSKEEVYSISDKARSLGGAVLEAYLYLDNKNRHEKIKTIKAGQASEAHHSHQVYQYLKKVVDR
ncbi:MAG: selenium-dependent molybdenum cofactor biosynthesis protein YqeB [Suipraeoptans sp.]